MTTSVKPHPDYLRVIGELPPGYQACPDGRIFNVEGHLCAWQPIEIVEVIEVCKWEATLPLHIIKWRFVTKKGPWRPEHQLLEVLRKERFWIDRRNVCDWGNLSGVGAAAYITELFLRAVKGVAK